MSIKILSSVWENGPAGRTQMLVLMALADHADANGQCWPSLRTIGLKARASLRAVRSALRELEAGDDPWISHVPGKRANGAQTSNWYQINLAKLGIVEVGKPIKTTPAEIAAPPAEIAAPPAKTAAPPGKNCRPQTPAKIAALEPINRNKGGTPAELTKTVAVALIGDASELQRKQIREGQTVVFTANTGDMRLVKAGTTEHRRLKEALEHLERN
jgi:hypothetical protein